MKKISIAMTTYNGEKYVLKQLKSLLVQSRKADEVIIFDDISTDNTPLIVRNFIKKNNLNDTWKFVINEENLGFIKNFAKALKHTTGDIIFLCDQDDIWHKDKLKIVENLFESNHDLSTLNTEILLIDENDKLHNSPKNIQPLKNLNLSEKLEKIELKKIISQNIVPGCTMAFTKEIKDLYLETSDFKFYHDYEINLISAMYGNIHIYNKPLIKYRVHSNNTIGLPLNNIKFKFSTNINIKKSKTKKDLNDFLNKFSIIKNYNVISDNSNTKALKQLNKISCFYINRLDFLESKSLLLWFKSLKYAIMLQDRIFIIYLLEDLIWLIKDSFKLKKE